MKYMFILILQWPCNLPKKHVKQDSIKAYNVLR